MSRDARPQLQEVAEKLRAMRKRRGWNQTELAEACGCTQSQVSRWEKQLDRPSEIAIHALAKIAGDDDRAWWLAQSAVPTGSAPPGEDRFIPILRDAAAAGTPREIEESETEGVLRLPKSWLRSGGVLYAVSIRGDSMEPVLLDGYMVIVDTAANDPKGLVNRMVVARADDGITVKWLREVDKTLMLVPQNLSSTFGVRVIKPGSGVSIVGEVVKWIGEPPSPRS